MPPQQPKTQNLKIILKIQHPKKMRQPKMLCSIKTLQGLIDLSGANTSNEIMSNGSNNEDNFPSVNKYDDDD